MKLYILTKFYNVNVLLEKFQADFNFTLKCLKCFCQKSYEKTYRFYDLFQTYCDQVHGRFFSRLKISLKKSLLFQNINKLFIIFTTFSNISYKTYEKNVVCLNRFI